MRTIAAVVVAVLGVPVLAQEGAKPGPEHDVLKKLVGTWDTTMKFGGMESKGTVTYKMELGGMWLTGALQGEMFGQKFEGRSLDSYDATRKKYVGVWVDSMGGAPVVTEGTYDAAKKTMTMAGEGPGMDGKATKYRSVSVMSDDDTVQMAMYIGDTKEPSFTITYKRKK